MPKLSMSIFNLLLLFVALTFVACSKEKPVACLIKENDSLYFVELKTDTLTDRWRLAYPVYQFQLGDINNDGKEEMMVGVINTTRFDPQKSKRLFIFKNYYGYIRPLWLGSRLGQPLLDFCFIQTEDGPRIRSIEIEKSGHYLVAEYQWRQFGLHFTQYLKRETTLDCARKALKQ